MNCHHFNNVSRTFQDLNESIAPADFHLKELNNCVLYFHLVFDDGTKFPKLLESIKVDDDLNTEKSKLFRKLPSVYTKYRHRQLQ